MTSNEIGDLIDLMVPGVSYGDVLPRPYTSPKGDFKRLGSKWLRAVAKRMGLHRGDYREWFDSGGHAVTGECVLHADHVYVVLSTLGIMYRTVRDRRDFAGGQNHWLPTSAVRDIDAAAVAIAAILKKHDCD